MTRFIVLCVAYGTFGALSIASEASGQVSLSPPMKDAEIIGQINAAWLERTIFVKSAKFETKIDENVSGRSRPPTAALRPAEDRLFEVYTEYAFESGKIAFIRSSEVFHPEDPSQVRPQKMKLAFDGERTAMLVEETKLPMGTIIQGESADRDLFVHVDCLAIGLWLHPKKVLQHTAWLVDKMSMEEDSVDVGGIPCRRIRIPRDGKGWTSALDVDSQNEWLPIQWQTWSRDRLTMKVTIGYREDQSVGAVVKEWTVTNYDASGKRDKTRRGVVLRYSVNTEIEDDKFTVQFPVGTHVSDMTDETLEYYEQGTRGLEPIKDSEFGNVD